MLLEALIAILIFSVGILGLVGAQATAIKSASEAKYRADASFLANQVLAQMWVNRANLASYAYTGGGAPQVLQAWLSRVNDTLPGAAANPPSIVIGPGSEVTVTLFWQHPEEANRSPAAAPHRFMATASINCC
jgi:type IV pilus assembly protein PilV